MVTTVEAIYEDGVLRLNGPLDLEDGTHVRVTIMEDAQTNSDEPSVGKTPPKKTPAEILAEIAAMPLQGNPGPFGSRDHDQILYGEYQTRHGQ